MGYPSFMLGDIDAQEQKNVIIELYFGLGEVSCGGGKLGVGRYAV